MKPPGSLSATRRWGQGMIGKGMQLMGQETIDSRASLRRAAILMTTFDERVARALLGKLPPMQRARLRRAMADLDDVDPLERRRAQNDFYQETRRQTTAGDSTRTAYDSDSVELRLQGKTSSDRSSETATPAADAPPLAFLSDVPDDVLLGAIVGEHPQTIAIVLASLAPHQAARLLPGLSDSLRAQALTRLARLEQLPPDALDSIGDHLRRLLADAKPTSIGAGAGGRSLQAILAELPHDAVQGVAAALGIDPQNLAANHRASSPVARDGSTTPRSEPPRVGAGAGEATLNEDYFTGPRIAMETIASNETPRAGVTFSDDDHSSDKGGEQPVRLERVDAFLGGLPTDVLREALSRLQTRQALLALCGLSRKDADRVLRSLPRRQSKQIRKQLAAMGPLTISEVDEAKRGAAEMAGLQRDRKSEIGTANASLLTAA